MLDGDPHFAPALSLRPFPAAARGAASPPSTSRARASRASQGAEGERWTAMKSSAWYRLWTPGMASSAWIHGG